MHSFFSDELAWDIWNKKYRFNGESFEQFIDRVSGGNDAIKDLIMQKKFCFGGRILANRWIEGRRISLSNCYGDVVEEDSLEAIMDAGKRIARTFSVGGGVGLVLNNLAPRGSVINNSAKTTTGAPSFMSLYNTISELIGSEGRRSALLLALASNHPDIFEFIDIKNTEGAITKANISVMADDKLFEDYIEGNDYDLHFERHTGDVTHRKVNPKEIIDKIAYSNWLSAEPGMLFWDRVQNYNLMQHVDDFQIDTLNACSEAPLPQHGACLLGSVNLSEFVDDVGEFEFEQFCDAVYNATIGLNEVLDESIEMHALQEQRDVARRWRQIGLGVMGYGDMLIKMDLKYGSKRALEFTDFLFKSFYNMALSGSSDYADITGKVFEGFDYDKMEQSDIWKYVEQETRDLIKEQGISNATVASIAPTGSIALFLGGVSGGIEPLFSLSYKRRTESLYGETKYYDIESPVIEWYRERVGLNDSDELPEHIVTAMDIDFYDRIKTQSVIQKYVDMAISSTINLPETATVTDVRDLYEYAWRMGLKGVTVYRQGCAREGVLTTGDETKSTKLERGDWAKLSHDIDYIKKKVHTGCGKLNMFIGYSPTNNRIEEFWIKKSGKGGCEKNIDSIAIAMSSILRLGGNIENIEKAFEGLGSCPSFSSARAKGKKLTRGNNCATAMYNVLYDFEKDMGFATPLNQVIECIKCVECGEIVVFEGGCTVCKACGYTRCD